MKPSSPFLRTFTTLFIGAGVLASLRAQDPAADLRPAVIVLRHAEDAQEWVDKSENPFSGQPASDETPGTDPWPSRIWTGQVPMWPEYHHPFVFIDHAGTIGDAEANGFEIALHGLSGNWQTAGGKKGRK